MPSTERTRAACLRSVFDHFEPASRQGYLEAAIEGAIEFLDQGQASAAAIMLKVARENFAAMNGESAK